MFPSSFNSAHITITIAHEVLKYWFKTLSLNLSSIDIILYVFQNVWTKKMHIYLEKDEKHWSESVPKDFKQTVNLISLIVH